MLSLIGFICIFISSNSKYPIKATSLLDFGTKLATMTRKFDSENYKIKFWGINFLVILDNFCSVNSSLLLKQAFISSNLR
jgi:hypothetical protein